MVSERKDEKTEMVNMWREMEVRSKKQEVTKRKQSITGIQLKAQQDELNVTKREQ